MLAGATIVGGPYPGVTIRVTHTEGQIEIVCSSRVTTITAQVPGHAVVPARCSSTVPCPRCAAHGDSITCAPPFLLGPAFAPASVPSTILGWSLAASDRAQAKCPTIIVTVTGPGGVAYTGNAMVTCHGGIISIP
jgi:hypothetical protein